MRGFSVVDLILIDSVSGHEIPQKQNRHDAQKKAKKAIFPPACTGYGGGNHRDKYKTPTE